MCEANLIWGRISASAVVLCAVIVLAGCGPIRGGGRGDDDDSTADDDDAVEREGDQPGECDDGADNDSDGDFDCDDADCAGAPACAGDDDDSTPVGDDDDATPWARELDAPNGCIDGTDNDGDGLADCDDSDCWGTPACLEGDDDDSASDDDDTGVGDDDTAPMCPGGYVVDCDGTCTNASWLGNGICNDALDCSAFGRDGGDCCFDSTECGTSEYCSNSGTCTDVFSTLFTITVWQADVLTYNSNGEAWDFPGGMPDPYAEVRNGGINGTPILYTAVEPDSFATAWAESVQTYLDPAGLCVIVWDEDVSADDQIDGSCWNGAAAVTALARNGGYVGNLYSGYANVDFSIYE